MQLSKGIIRPVASAIRLEAYGTRFGVRSDTGLNKDSLEVVSFNNYEAMKIRNNPKFANQTPGHIYTFKWRSKLLFITRY